MNLYSQHLLRQTFDSQHLVPFTHVYGEGGYGETALYLQEIHKYSFKQALIVVLASQSSMDFIAYIMIHAMMRSNHPGFVKLSTSRM